MSHKVKFINPILWESLKDESLIIHSFSESPIMWYRKRTAMVRILLRMFSARSLCTTYILTVQDALADGTIAVYLMSTNGS